MIKKLLLLFILSSCTLLGAKKTIRSVIIDKMPHYLDTLVDEEIPTTINQLRTNKRFNLVILIAAKREGEYASLYGEFQVLLSTPLPYLGYDIDSIKELHDFGLGFFQLYKRYFEERDGQLFLKKGSVSVPEEELFNALVFNQGVEVEEILPSSSPLLSSPPPSLSKENPDIPPLHLTPEPLTPKPTPASVKHPDPSPSSPKPAPSRSSSRPKPGPRLHFIDSETFNPKKNNPDKKIKFTIPGRIMAIGLASIIGFCMQNKIAIAMTQERALKKKKRELKKDPHFQRKRSDKISLSISESLACYWQHIKDQCTNQMSASFTAANLFWLGILGYCIQQTSAANQK